MQISDHWYLEKVLRNLRQKLHLTEGILGIEAMNTNLLIWGLCMATTMKAAVHLGPNYTENMKICKNANLEEIQNFVQWHSKVDNGPSCRDSECINS